MAIVNVPAPRQANISPVLNFMLQMSSLRERKETRKLQERQVAVDEGALALKQGQSPYEILQMEAAVDQMDATTEETYKKTEALYGERIQALTREGITLANAGLAGDAKIKKQQAKQLKLETKELKRLKEEEPELFSQMILSSRIADVAQGEIRELTAGIQASQLQLAQTTQAHKVRMDALGQKMVGLSTMESPNDRHSMAVAIQNEDQEGIKLAAVGEMAYRDAERAKGSDVGLEAKQTTPVTEKLIDPNIDRTTEYSPDAMTSLRIAQDTGTQPPELRKIKVKERVGFGTLGPYGWIGPKQFQVMTEQEARSKGFGTQWDAQNVAEPVSVKEGVKSAVKKTTGTKKPTKETTKQVTDSRGWIKFVSPDGVDTWVNPNDVELAKSRGYTLGTK